MTDSTASESSLRAFLEAIETELAAVEGAEAVPAVAYACARRLAFDEDALRSTLRRALFVVAAGGDPHRDLSPDDVAVRRLAAELRDPARQGELERGLEDVVGRLAAELRDPARQGELERGLEDVSRAAAGLELVSRAVSTLRHDPDLAWHWVALALLAGELAEEPAS